MTNATTTLLVFVGYLLIMFLLTLFAGSFLIRPKSFVSEYFLGGRSMSSWTLALSFAATCISGGTFAGFPSLIYTHGWILFLWIGSFMLFPMFTMGLMGKRLNQLSHRMGSVTIPDIIRDRYQSTTLGIFASFAIIFFLTVNLVAQFKSGGIILDVIMRDAFDYDAYVTPFLHSLPILGDAADKIGPGYVFSLILFSVITIVYTSYGGFRAVVWTDTMQGIVMFVGVLILLPVVLIKVGGLGEVTRKLAAMPPLTVIGTTPLNNAIEYTAAEGVLNPVYVEHFSGTHAKPTLAVEIVPHERGGDIVRVHLPKDANGKINFTAREVASTVNSDEVASKLITSKVHGDSERAGHGLVMTTPAPKRLVSGKDRVYGPSLTERGEPFHPLGMAISFFVLWCFSGAGHPGFLVRLMAFKNSRDLRYSIVTVTIYFAMVYVPLVFIFVAGRTLVHPADLTGGSDEIMPTLAKTLVHPLLAGLLIAAPFSAVTSTVEAFLLTVSSSVVRDIYQRTIHPNASERAIKVGSYLVTVTIGIIVMFLSLDPPPFLQDIVVFSSSGIAATFLVATFLGIYWKSMTTSAAWAAMISGFVIVVTAHVPILLRRFGLPGGGNAIVPLGIDSFVWACVISLILGVLVSYVSRKPSDAIVQAYFGREKAKSSMRSESGELA